MAAQGIHHLGLAVEDLDEAISTYRRLFGAELEERETQDEQGVEAASLGYVGKHASALSLGEAATLAGLIQSPSTYAPTSDPSKAIRR